MRTIFEYCKVLDELLVKQLKQNILDIYNLSDDVTYFPGQLPCSLMRKDIKLISATKYWVAAKTDGERVLIYIATVNNTPYSFLVDRGFRFYYTNLKFSGHLQASPGLGTLLDGEMIEEPDGIGPTCIKIYIHDIICYAGHKAVANETYDMRMLAVSTLLRWSYFPTEPQGNANNNGNEGPGSTSFVENPYVRAILSQNIQVLPKKIFPFSQLNTLHYDVVPKLPHKCDGYILTPHELPHQGRKCKQLFKFKKPEDHTLDLRLGRRVKIGNGTDGCVDGIHDIKKGPYDVYDLQTWDTKEWISFATIGMAPNLWNAIGITANIFDNIVTAGKGEAVDGKSIILECRYNGARNLWVPVAVRHDKLVPNDSHTVKRTIQTMMEGLTIAELLNIAKHVREDEMAKSRMK